MLPNVLERGVLLWLTADGLYAKRLCQGRVYWEGPLAPYVDKPNKLEKEQPCKLFDTHQFLVGKQQYQFTPADLETIVQYDAAEYKNPAKHYFWEVFKYRLFVLFF